MKYNYQPVVKFIKEDVIPVTGISVVILLFCLLYIFTFGTRMTQARNLYVEGYNLIQLNSNEEAKKVLEESNSLWFSYETQKLIDSIK